MSDELKLTLVDHAGNVIPDAEVPPSIMAALGILAADQVEWPDGHPCRDCGRLFKEHVPVPNDQCEGWR